MNKKDVSEARLQLHQAAQLLAAAGISFLDRKEDDSHTNMLWDSDLQALSGHGFGRGNKFRLALNFPQLKYLFLINDVFSEFELDGKTQNDAVAWFQNIIEEQGIDSSRFSMDRHYQIPMTGQAHGEKYKLFDDQVFKMLSEQFTIAHKLLSELNQKNKNVSAVRCWPHHFDLAMLITVEENENPEKMKSVGLGLSPGDETYDQPYYYVSPWPYPPPNRLIDNDLPNDAFWHSKGFTSAILLAESYLTFKNIEDGILRFLNTAVELSKKMI